MGQSQVVGRRWARKTSFFPRGNKGASAKTCRWQVRDMWKVRALPTAHMEKSWCSLLQDPSGPGSFRAFKRANSGQSRCEGPLNTKGSIQLPASSAYSYSWDTRGCPWHLAGAGAGSAVEPCVSGEGAGGTPTPVGCRWAPSGESPGGMETPPSQGRAGCRALGGSDEMWQVSLAGVCLPQQWDGCFAGAPVAGRGGEFKRPWSKSCLATCTKGKLLSFVSE